MADIASATPQLKHGFFGFRSNFIGVVSLEIDLILALWNPRVLF